MTDVETIANPLESATRSNSTEPTSTPKRTDSNEGFADSKPEPAAVAAVFAQLGTAPTNWHQATIFFLTSKSEKDASMRRKAPCMFVAGLAMVLVQLVAMYGILSAMDEPRCINNHQCDQIGYYCKESQCSPCGSDAPLVPYLSDIPIPGERYHQSSTNGGQEYKIYNKIWDQSYPHRSWGTKRSDVPDGFAGYNMTISVRMLISSDCRRVLARCVEPIRRIGWAIEQVPGNGDTEVLMSNRGDLPPELTPGKTETKEFSAKTIRAWCAACTRRLGPEDYVPEPLEDYGIAVYDSETGVEVSVMNNKLRSILVLAAMSRPDWMALLLCSYVVGMTVVGEIKDTALCRIAIERNIKELTIGWQIGLELLNTLRSQFFLLPLMAAVPVVVLTQGGSALQVCFNTIAILFITEIDNMSYHLILGERVKERVDTYGHIVLTDEDAVRLARAKMLSTFACVVGTVALVYNGALVAARMASFAIVLIFKLSDHASTSGLSFAQQIVFALRAVVVQICAFATQLAFVGW